MKNIKFDRKALTEVYQVLLMLEKDKFNKIPRDIIDGIKNNMDVEYEIDINYIEKEMLPDTEKILATIYTYYLTSQEEKNTIFQMIELEKKKKYENKEIFKEKKEKQIVEEKVLEIVPVNNSIIQKIKMWLRRILKK